MRALVKRSSDLTGLTFPVLPVNWNSEIYDTDGFWTVGSPGRFTIPSGVTIAKLTAGIEVTANASAGSIFVNIFRNGSEVVANAVAHARSGATGFTSNIGFAMTPWLEVSPGDYFEVRANVNGIGSPTAIINTNRTFFSIEAE